MWGKVGLTREWHSEVLIPLMPMSERNFVRDRANSCSCGQWFLANNGASWVGVWVAAICYNTRFLNNWMPKHFFRITRGWKTNTNMCWNRCNTLIRSSSQLMLRRHSSRAWNLWNLENGWFWWNSISHCIKVRHLFSVELSKIASMSRIGFHYNSVIININVNNFDFL